MKALLRALGCVSVLLASSIAASGATFTVTNDNDSGAGSLRQAILDANAAPGADTIAFSLSPGLQTIAPPTPLPVITDPVTIDGYTQPGTSLNTLAVGDNRVLLIRLDGVNQSFDGLTFGAGAAASVVRGLVMGRYDNAINSDVQLNVTGCFIGINADGVTPFSNQVGILHGGAGGTIGGLTPGSRNVVSGNTAGGIGVGMRLTGSFLIVNGNYIGTNAAGTAAVSNRLGISVLGTQIDIGGVFGGNLISGNVGAFLSPGIELTNGASSVNIFGNSIGLNAAGTSGIPNTYGIITTQSPTLAPTFIRIGALSAPNRIAFNTQDGISLTLAGPVSGQNILISSNSIHDNGGLGIDLNNDGVTPNDTGDADVGPNLLQNYPVLTAATFSAGNITISGALNSTPSTFFAIEFFQNPACGPQNHGQGQTLLGTTTVTTDAGGNATFGVTFPGSNGGVVTSVASVQGGPQTWNTSEFSACQAVSATVPGAIPALSPSLLLLLSVAIAAMAASRLRS